MKLINLSENKGFQEKKKEEIDKKFIQFNAKIYIF